MTPTRLLISAVALTVAFASPAISQATLTTFAEISDTRPGNITVTPDNRVIITQQPLDGPALRVVEVLKDGTKVPFPTQDWADGPETGEVGIAGTIGIKSDANGIVWILDMAAPTARPSWLAGIRRLTRCTRSSRSPRTWSRRSRSSRTSRWMKSAVRSTSPT